MVVQQVAVKFRTRLARLQTMPAENEISRFIVPALDKPPALPQGTRRASSEIS
jgi:hypothetical protein